MAVRDVVQAAAGVGGGNEYVEDVFSTYLHTGNNSTQTINNGIDLDGEGGLVWIKGRSLAYNNTLTDTERGAGQQLVSNRTDAQAYYNNGLTSFSSTGFSIGAQGQYNLAPETYVSWTFRKAPKFFDVVTYTGTGVARTIAHSLESTPACIFIKRTDVAGEWRIWNSNLSTPNTQLLYLNRTDAVASTSVWSTTSPTDTEFSLNNASSNNASGGTFVAYLFASNAGGFGDDGEQNVISCGSVSGFGTVVNLGFEPQWILMKQSNGTSDWIIADNMRGIATGGNDALLFANTSGAETSANDWIDLTSTGFVNNVGSGTFIYIAIRRGPMKTPESGTEVFAPTIGVASTPSFVGNFPVDFCIAGARGSTDKWWEVDRLRGPQRLNSASTAAESSATYVSFDNMIGCMTDAFSAYMGYVFRRAPGFFDVVAYTGTGVGGRTVAHNLTVAPEMIITKNRSGPSDNWLVFTQPTGNSGVLVLQNTDALYTPYFDWVPTSTTFSVGAQGFGTNDSGINYVSYLFASLPGVSKVGSYTGTGVDLNVDCGFSAGARFILIKRTDASGDWYVWDSARGIVAGNDPYLLLNSTAAEEPNTDYIDPLASGFTVTSNASSTVNVNTGTYIFLAIA